MVANLGKGVCDSREGGARRPLISYHVPGVEGVMGVGDDEYMPMAHPIECPSLHFRDFVSGESTTHPLTVETVNPMIEDALEGFSAIKLSEYALEMGIVRQHSLCDKYVVESVESEEQPRLGYKAIYAKHGGMERSTLVIGSRLILARSSS